MKILLTGATGLIGKEVGKLLVQRGHDVIAVTRSKQKADLDLPFQATLVEWEGGNHPFPNSILEHVDAVVNLMGENLSTQRWSDHFKDRLYESRVGSTRSLVIAAQSSKKLKAWIQGSAIGFYGSVDSEFPVDEMGSKGEGFLADLCQDWETEIDSLNSSIRRVVVRTGVVFSHQGGAFSQMLTPLMNGLAGALGTGRQKIAIIHLEDMARFISYAVEMEAVKGIYNLVAHEPVEQKILVEKLCRDLHLKSGPSVPAFALRLMLGEMANALVENQNVISTRMHEAGFELKYKGVDDVLTEISRWHLDPFHSDSSTFVFAAEQFIQQPIEKVFAFFSDANNLQKVMPEHLHLKIDRISENPIQKNTRIYHSLRAYQFPIHWVTQIDQWDPPYHFSDHQLEGPYSLWYHDHRFEEVEGGTLVTDWVRYRLPLGKFAQWVGLAKIRSDLTEIFHHRRRSIRELIQG